VLGSPKERWPDLSNVGYRHWESGWLFLDCECMDFGVTGAFRESGKRSIRSWIYRYGSPSLSKLK